MDFHPWAGKDLSFKINGCDQTSWKCVLELYVAISLNSNEIEMGRPLTLKIHQKSLSMV